MRAVEHVSGKKMILRGYRGRGSKAKTWNIVLFKEKYDTDGHIVEAEFGYRGSFWNLTQWGDVKRVVNGKYYTLCSGASIFETDEEL